ncbi:NAD-dependent dehydratase [Candidatus Berkelbacteria bacterium CG1_02_42_45]|uniref:NAD-dependent dehydratase n=1 Tax=Candidatus Berkelbacteria bacterium CG1_02_42_45 TaxID=1805036 RepID=A0A1J4RNX4_9BACT|nr:MAG: NAD-dependent dehydratase [Candidatus Berkelbacteria bacterium CG1_02_42_45]
MENERKALVCGAGGFIGSHLVELLKKKGYWIRGVDLKHPEFAKTAADDFLILDLREEKNCQKAFFIKETSKPEFDEVYQLAADMGGMGFIHSAECEIMRNSALINIYMIHSAADKGIKKYFFSSSVCVYRDMKPGEPEMPEEGAYPALPDNEYGWEKLYAERMAMAYGRKFGMDVKIARFQNCYGPEGTWTGGREKAPAAISRKIAEAQQGGTIEVWGDGSAIRSYIYVDDLIDGIYRLVHSDLSEPANIGSPQYVSVDELVEIVDRISGKNINIEHVPGPVGVQSRNFSNKKIYSLGWWPKYSLEHGMEITYNWVKGQVEKAKGKKS